MWGEAPDSGDPPPPSPRDPLLLLADPVPGPAMWDAVVPLLSGGFVVLREPPPPAVAPSPDLPAPDAAGWAERELVLRNLYPVHLVASGFGAAAAIRLARQRPELLRSLVLHAPIVRFGPEVGPGAPAWTDVRERFAPVAAALEQGDGIGARRAWRAALLPPDHPLPSPTGVALGIDPAQRGWLADWRDPAAWTVSSPADFDFLPPVLVLDGAVSPPFLHRIAGELARGFPNVTRMRLPDADPLLPEVDPQRLAAVLFSFCLERNVPTA